MKRKIVIREFMTRPSTKLPPASVAKNTQEHCYFPLKRMLVNHRVILSSMLPEPIYTVKFRLIMATSVLLYCHLVITATFLWPPGKNRHTFSCKKTLFKTATLLIWPNVFRPIGDLIIGVPLYIQTLDCAIHQLK